MIDIPTGVSPRDDQIDYGRINNYDDLGQFVSIVDYVRNANSSA